MRQERRPLEREDDERRIGAVVERVEHGPQPRLHLATRETLSLHTAELWPLDTPKMGSSESTAAPRLAAPAPVRLAVRTNRESSVSGGEAIFRAAQGVKDRLGFMAQVKSELQLLFDFLDEHDDHPFFIWFAPMLPHAPMDPPAELRRPYAEQGLAESAELQRRAAEGSAVDGGGEVEMTQAECEQLRMLGYVEDCSEASAP